MASVIDRLEAHGVRFVRTEKAFVSRPSATGFASSTLADREYQARTRCARYGHVGGGGQTIPPGSLIVPMDQPLARLAFLLFDRDLTTG